MKTKTPTTVTIAKITLFGTIAVAVISLIGNLVLGYWQFQRTQGEANQAIPTPELNTLSIEQIPREIFVFDGSADPQLGEAALILGSPIILISCQRITLSMISPMINLVPPGWVSYSPAE
jgi:hypothetical protein